jgi:hypothetical protein
LGDKIMSLIGSLFGGATAAQQQQATGSEQFAQAMQNATNTQLGNELGYQNTIANAGQQLMAGGPNKFGFSTAENANLVGTIENGGATATANSLAASRLSQQQASGGAQTMPSGAQAAINAQVGATGAQNTASALAQEREAGYQAGAQQYGEGVNATGEAAQLANPTGYAGATTNAEGQALSAENAVQSANANSLTAKLLGGAIQGGLNLATSGLSTLMNNAINNQQQNRQNQQNAQAYNTAESNATSGSAQFSPTEAPLQTQLEPSTLPGS